MYKRQEEKGKGKYKTEKQRLVHRASSAKKSKRQKDRVKYKQYKRLRTRSLTREGEELKPQTRE